MNVKFHPMILVLLSLGLALAVSHCGGQTPESMTGTGIPVGEPYKIGALIGITGGASTMGIPERNTIEMLAKKLQAAGGIQGPDGLMHPVEVVIYDTESEETKAVLAAKKLIEEDQAAIILGPSTSGEALALVDTVTKAEIPLIAMASSKQIVEPVQDRQWIFKVTWNDSLTVRAALEWLRSAGVDKVAWLSINNGFGDSGLQEAEVIAPELGIELVAIEKMEPGDTDMTAQLTKIRGTDANGLILYSTIPELAIAAKNRYDLGIDLPWFAIGGSSHPKFVELAGAEALEGVHNVSGKVQFLNLTPDTDAQRAVIEEYNEQYMAQYGVAADQFGGHAYDAFQIAIWAMQQVGADRAAIRDQLEDMEFIGCSGTLQWSPQDHAGMTVDSLLPLQVVNGEWTLARR